jgi:hypothetical protein
MRPWIGDYVDVGDFTGLFVEELGWNRPSRHRRSVTVTVDDDSYTLTEAASYKGVVIWVCPAVPSRHGQRAIDRKLKDESVERVVIFHDKDLQVWRWPQARDAAGAGAPSLVSHDHIVGRPNEALRQRLKFIKIDIDGPEVTVVEIVRRLRRAFDSERVTKAFYAKFAQQHRDLTAVIEGIAVSDRDAKPELRWYGSILLNRLMFIYFMQRKGFLDGDHDYLRNRLRRVTELKRPGSFYEFYTDFLVPLFHEGLGADAASRAINDAVIAELIGDIPYINGGIFSKHPLEIANTISVPDDAFEQIFDFFDQWQWHLDDRPTGNPNEINPDVLGYIFEQFVNNSEEVAKDGDFSTSNADKGAFYTKEDVTGFMTANALIPVFLERLHEVSGVNVWRSLSQEPERYVWPSLAHGCEMPLPSDIQDQAFAFPRPAWESHPVPAELGLPTESWWEVVDRRRTHAELLEKMTNGGISGGDSAVKANINLEALAIDVIDALDSPDDVITAWHCLSTLKVLDPTCGSGAFLFAALNTLHRLYSSVFEVAEIHAKTSDNTQLRALIDSKKLYPNQDYFLLKHAALNNIYGVDLMHEAVEIARLRLFLKLIAQIDDRSDIRPLPDLDFNIRAGNALVGAASTDEILAKVDLLSQGAVSILIQGTEEASESFRHFVSVQESGAPDAILAAKRLFATQVTNLRNQLNTWWWESSTGSESLEAYELLSSPMHWFVEFPDAMFGGGFDVVLGNPPYVPSSLISYQIDDCVTQNLPDIYGPTVERALKLLKPNGRLAMITPHSLMQSRNFRVLRQEIVRTCGAVLCSAFARIPSGLFENDVRVRNAIVLARRSDDDVKEIWTSRCRRWYAEFRPHVMSLIRYVEVSPELDQWPFVDDGRLLAAFDRIKAKFGGRLVLEVAKSDPTNASRTLYFKSNAYNYLSVAMEPVPVINPDGSTGKTTAQREIFFDSTEARDTAYLLLAGRLGLAWWGMYGDDFNVTKGVLESMPGGYRSSSPDTQRVVSEWSPQLKEAQSAAIVWKLNGGKRVGNWNLALCRHITDQSDLELLTVSQCSLEEIEAVWLAYDRIYMGGID